MFKSKKSKIAAILALLIAGGLLVLFIFLQFIVIGPGLPPSEGMAEWYIPEGNRIMECTPYFPEISRYCSYINYTRSDFGDQYFLIASWYFNDAKKFKQAQERLYRYLKSSGQVSTVELNISEEMAKEIKSRKNRQAWGPTYGSKTFYVTQYEGKNTSGYFLVYTKPFLSNRDDYFIVYYGTFESVVLYNQTSVLKNLIAEEYYLTESGTVGEIK